MSKITVVCETCKKEFEKEKGEYNRRIRLGREKMYCGLSCSGRAEYQINHLNRIRSNYPIWNHSGRRLDEFSPFRETFRRAARHKDKECTLSLLDLKHLWESQNGICPFTGWNLDLPTQSKKYKLSIKTASLDRINNSKGYHIDNVRFVSVIYNLARNIFSDEDVADFAKAITIYSGDAGYRLVV